MSDGEAFRFGDPTSDVFVEFTDAVWPHDDALTLVTAVAGGPLLSAQLTLESLDGDNGFLLPSAPTRSGGEVFESATLSTFLQDLGGSEWWDGPRSWRSLGEELRVDVTCDRLGHAELAVTLAPMPYKRTWSTTVRVNYALGDLQRLGRDLSAWFAGRRLQS